MKKNILLLSMLFFLFSGCDFSIWEIKNKDEKKPIQKKNSISELKPKHRFAMPLEDVKNEKKAKETSKNIAKYNIADIAEITEEVIKNYPFESKANGYKRNMEMIKQDFPKLTKEEFIANDSLITNYYDANLDYEVLQVLKKTKTPKKEKKEVKLKLNIKDLTRPPMEVREEQAFSKGGSNAVDELRRREAAERERKRKEREEARKRAKWCRENPVECERQRKEEVIKWATQEASKIKSRCGSIENYYPIIYLKIPSKLLKIEQVISVLDRLWSGFLYTSRKYFTVWNTYWEVDKENLEGGDNKIDAIRHMYWQALLCNNYGGSLEARLDFAKRVGDLYEECGDNNSDSMAMDYHNNRVGRQVVYRENARTYKEWCCFGYEWWVSYIGVHHIDSAVLLQRAKDLAKKNRINVEDKIIKSKNDQGEGVVELYPDYLNKHKGFYHAEKICNRTYWIENNAWKYINKPIILAESPPEAAEEYYR